jgi:predicted PurR-regulated permease PerM
MPNGPVSSSDRRYARLLITPRSIAIAVALFGLGVLGLGILSASTRVLGWLAASAVLASLLSPAVTRLARHIPRALAFISVLLVLLVVVGGSVWLLVDDVQTQTERLRREAPAAARRIEQSERWGKPARQFKLEQRTREFLRDAPLTLQGGEGAKAVQAAASRSVAYLGSAVLTIFLMIYGHRLFLAGVGQIRYAPRRERVQETVLNAHRRALVHLSWRVVVFLTVGVATGLMLWGLEEPAPVVLALFVATWSLIPTIGIAIGAVVVAIFVAALTSTTAALVVLGALAVFQAADILLARRLVHPAVQVGPFLSLFALMVGIEVYGAGGALVSLVIMTWLAALVVQLAPTDEDVIEPADLGVEGLATGTTGDAA